MGALAEKACFKHSKERLDQSIPASFFDFKIRDIDGNLISF